MKRKGYCKVASAILGTTVLTVPELSNSANGLRVEVVDSQRESVEIRAGVSFLMPETASSGLIRVADLQYSILYTSGDTVYSAPALKS